MKSGFGREGGEMSKILSTNRQAFEILSQKPCTNTKKDQRLGDSGLI